MPATFRPSRTLLSVLCSLAMGATLGSVEAATTIDMVVAIDESGSMAGEQAFIGPYVQGIDTLLNGQGVTVNRYGLTGYGASSGGGGGLVLVREDSGRAAYRQMQVGAGQMGTAGEFAAATPSLVTSGGTEDGYRTIDFILRQYNNIFRSDAGVSILLITDEDRDDDSFGTTGAPDDMYAATKADLAQRNIVLHAVVNQRLTASNGQPAVAVDADNNAYVEDGNGGYTVVKGYTIGSASGTTTNDYTNLALELKGIVGDIDRLRAGGLTATSFASALTQLLITASQVQQPAGGIDWVALAQTPTQLAVAQVLTQNQVGQFNNIVTGLLALANDPSRRNGLQQLTPMQLFAAGIQAYENAARRGLLISQRIGARLGRVGPQPGTTAVAFELNGQRLQPYASSGSTGGSAGADDGNRGFFFRGAVGKSEYDITPFADGYSADNYSLTAGMDRKINSDLLVGASLGYDRTDTKYASSDSSLDHNNYNLAAYASYRFKPDWYVDGILGIGYTDYDSKRATVLGTALGSTDALSLNASFGVSHDIAWGEAVLRPFARLHHSYLDISGFTESGAGAANLIVGSHTQDATNSEIGATVTKKLSSTKMGNLFGELHLSWEHQFSKSADIPSSFATAPATVFNVNIPKADEDYFRLGLGLVHEGDMQSYAVRFNTLLEHSEMTDNVLEFNYRRAF